MKFISKNNKLCVVLKPGIPAEPITGRQAVPGLYIRFEEGIVNIKDEDVVERMKNHLGFGSDFVILEEEKKDPFAETRVSAEPEHNILELEGGLVKKNVNPKPRVTFTSQQKKIIKEMVKEEGVKLAKEIAPELAKEMLKNIIKEKNKDKIELTDSNLESPKVSLYGDEEVAQEKPKGRGRPPIIKPTEDNPVETTQNDTTKE